MSSTRVARSDGLIRPHGKHGRTPKERIPLATTPPIRQNLAGYPVMKSAKTLLFALLTLLPSHAVTASEPDKMNTVAAVEGTWTLAYADVKHPDGTRAHDYGDAPKGLLQIDHAGHYSLLIFDSSRPRFAANDRNAGTPSEFRAAAIGTSSHFGTVDIDPTKGTLTFHIEGATYT